VSTMFTSPSSRWWPTSATGSRRAVLCITGLLCCFAGSLGGRTAYRTRPLLLLRPAVDALRWSLARFDIDGELVRQSRHGQRLSRSVAKKHSRHARRMYVLVTK
jgi:hypothetical protein